MTHDKSALPDNPPARHTPHRLVIAGAVALGLAGAVAAAVALGTHADDEGEPLRTAVQPAGRGFGIGWEDLLAGDCHLAVGEGEVYTLDVVPCAEPHRGEIIAVTELPDGPWQGEDDVQDAAWNRCIPEFEDFTGATYTSEVTSLWPISPTSASWEVGHRDVACDLDLGYDVIGSLRGRGDELADGPEALPDDTTSAPPAPQADKDPGDLVVDTDPRAVNLGTCYLVVGLPSEVATLPVVPCATPHGGEAYAKRYLERADVPGGKHPGAEAMSTLAAGICAEELERFTGARTEDSRYRVWFAAPDEFALDWRAQSPEILCFLESREDTLTGSVRGSEKS